MKSIKIMLLGIATYLFGICVGIALNAILIPIIGVFATVIVLYGYFRDYLKGDDERYSWCYSARRNVF